MTIAGDVGSAGERVLGTRIERLAPHTGPAFLISDLHVPADGGAALAKLHLALAAAVRERARLFVLGDLFDSYVARAQLRHGVWRDVGEAMRAATTAGIGIDLLVGNRDFLLGPEFPAATGARLHHGGMRLQLNGVDTLLLHGDELCLDDVPYQRAKRWLRSGPVRFLARRLPLGLALRAAERARRRSMQVIRSGDQSRFLPTRAAIAAAMAGGVQRLVFGHIHRHATVAVGGGRVDVLPAFDAAAVGFRSDSDGLRAVRFVTGGSGWEPLAEAPAQLFASDGA